MNFLPSLFAALLLGTVTAYAQTPASSLLAPTKSPQDPVPGLLARIHLGDAHTPKSSPTHLLCIVNDGKEWFDKDNQAIADELRGKSSTSMFYYFASGYLILDQDTDVVFAVKDNVCMVDGKDFGQGTFHNTLKKGKVPIEICKCYGKGLNSFDIKGANGEQVLFHTGEMLNRELSHSVKLDKHTYKSKMLGDPDPKT